jgi:DNA-binding SARP family transcriptional activator
MEFRMLGSLEVERDGRPVALGGARQRALLAMLLLHRNQVVSVDRLVDELWPERPPKTAAQIVRVYVSQLRKVLGGDRLETMGPGYRLRTAADEVDADRFELLIADGRGLARAGDPAAVTTLREALALWRGPPLSELASEAFAQPAVARLGELRLACLENLYQAELDAGRSGELVAELEQLAASNPERERLWAQLMLALYRAGRQADALAAYRRLRAHLRDELGLEPGDALRQLEARVLQQDPTLEAGTIDSPASPIPAQPAPNSRRPLIAGLAGVALVALLIAGIAYSASSGGGQAPHLRPVTLALFGPPPDPSKPSSAIGDTITEMTIRGVQEGVREQIPGRVAYIDAADRRQFEVALGRQARRSGLVIIGATTDLDLVAKVVRTYPGTRFALPGVSIHDADFRPSNVTGIVFDDHEVGYLAGYLAALESGPTGRISAVGGIPVPTVRRIMAGFRDGALRARPSEDVLIDYAGSFVDQPACERVANDQIDAGSKVVFDVAGECGFGAIQTAGIRGVWAIGVDSDLSSLGPQVLASSIKRGDSAVRIAMELYAEHKLPAGRDVELNLGNDGVGLVGLSDQISASVRSRLERVAAELRARDRQNQP